MPSPKVISDGEISQDSVSQVKGIHDLLCNIYCQKWSGDGTNQETVDLGQRTPEMLTEESKGTYTSCYLGDPGRCRPEEWPGENNRVNWLAPGGGLMLLLCCWAQRTCQHVALEIPGRHTYKFYALRPINIYNCQHWPQNSGSSKLEHMGFMAKLWV